MGKANRLKTMWPCYALAIWWSYYELPGMKIDAIALKTQI
jgi:hypothetical protein